MSQTAIQQANTIRFGSGKFEVSQDGVTWIDLGAMNNVKFVESFSKVEVKSHNAGIIRSRMKDHKAKLTGDMLEVNFDKLYLIRGGLDIREVLPGTPSVGEVLTFASNTTEAKKIFLFPKQNYDKSLITVTAVYSDPAGLNTPMVFGTDYDVIKDENGNSNIIFFDDLAGVYDPSFAIRIIYNVTERARIRFYTGGRSTINAIQARITNTDENNRKFSITVFKATNSTGISLDFKDDDAEESNSVPIELEGSCDVSRSRGMQLFVIDDEQAA